MKTLSVSISDLEYTKFGLKNEQLFFTEFVELVSKELSKQALDKCVELSEKYGFAKITMKEIDEEVKAVRANAKSHN